MISRKIRGAEKLLNIHTVRGTFWFNANSKAYYHNFEVYNNEQSKRVSITSLQPKVPTSLSVTVCVSQMTSGFCFLLKGAGNRHDEEEGQSMLLFLLRSIKARLLLSLAKSCGCVRSASVRNSKVRQRPKSLKQRGKNHCFLNDCLFLPMLSTKLLWKKENSKTQCGRFQDFSATQILREINFRECINSKNCRFCSFRDSEFC